MNFEMSDEARQVAAEARTLLRERGATAGNRKVMAGEAVFDTGLWQEMGRLGWLGVNIPQACGGSEAGAEALCLLSEEVGRSLAAVPFTSTLHFAAEAIALFGSASQKSEHLAAIAAGALIATVALSEGQGDARRAVLACRVSGGRLLGSKWPVESGMCSDLAVVFALDEDAGGDIGAFLVRLSDKGVARRRLEGIDASRDLAAIDFHGAVAERLGDAGDGPHGPQAVERLLTRAAVPVAFEQIGGAQACLEMAVDYARTRYAFGQPIGTFQAIKHKLADIYIAIELARSNGYYAAWALSSGGHELPTAAASARIGASDAFWLAAKECIQTHGGFGVTAEADCHLYLRRARHLAALLGSSVEWKARLVAGLVAQPALWRN